MNTVILKFQSFILKFQTLCRLPEDDPRSLTHLYIAASYVCSLNNNQLHTLYANHVKPEKLMTLCFRAVYIYNFFTYGLNFSPLTDKIHLQKTLNVNGVEQDLGWALGAMVYLANRPELNLMIAEAISGVKPKYESITSGDDRPHQRNYQYSIDNSRQ